MPLKFDLSNDNFNHYFSKESSLLTEKQKEELPKELVYKLFKKGGKQSSVSSNKLSFLAKLFILIKALNKRVIILIEDEKGMDEEEYFKYKNLSRKKLISIDNAENIIEDGIFVIGNNEIVDSFNIMNLLSVSKPYKYLVKSKNSWKDKTSEAISAANYISKFLSYYESNRKTIAMKSGINMSEWLVLIYLYNGDEVESSTIHKDWYKYSFNSSKTKIKLAFSTLQSKGLVEKIGFSRGTKLKITALGKSKISELMAKYVLNC